MLNSEWKILTLNVGYNVMGNQVAGTEALMAQYCQDVYPLRSGLAPHSEIGGELAQCTLNSLPLLMDSDLSGLQEINFNASLVFIQMLLREGERKGRNLEIWESVYRRGQWGLLLISDQNVFGQGVPITPKHFPLSHQNNPSDVRGLQAVYYPLVKLLAINLHAPHHIPLRDTLNSALFKIVSLLGSAGLTIGDVQKVVVMGDFNDERQEVLQPGFSLQLGDLTITLPVPTETVPATCCADNQYQFQGDYVLLGGPVQDIQHYGVPLGFNRLAMPVSDHDPLQVRVSFH